MSTATIGRRGGRHAIGYKAPEPQHERQARPAPSRPRRVFPWFGALRRGGHQPGTAPAVEQMEATLAALPAPVVSPQPSGVNWEAADFAGAADPAQQITADDAVAAAVALLMSAAPVPDGDAPVPPATAAAANTAADYGHTTAVGAPRTFAAAAPVETGPFPVAFHREFGVDGMAVTRPAEQLFGGPRFAGLFPAGTDVVAEVNLGSGPAGSFAVAGNSLALRMMAAELTWGAHRYDLAVAAIAESEAAPVIAAEPEPEVAGTGIPEPAAEVTEVTEPVPAEDTPAEPVTEDEPAEVTAEPAAEESAA